MDYLPCCYRYVQTGILIHSKFGLHPGTYVDPFLLTCVTHTSSETRHTVQKLQMYLLNLVLPSSTAVDLHVVFVQLCTQLYIEIQLCTHRDT